MAATIGEIIVDPQGESLSVSITTASGASLSCFTARDGSTAHTFPQTITDRTVYYVTRPVQANVSCKRNTIELTRDGQPRPVYIDHGVAAIVQPISDNLNEAYIQAVAPTEVVGGAPTDASYVTFDAHAQLDNEKVLGDDVFMAGLDAAIPAAATAGRFYFATDDGILYRDSGLAWVQVAAAVTHTHSQYIAVAPHGANAAYSRPSATYVFWLGSVEPDEMQDDVDVWLDSA